MIKYISVGLLSASIIMAGCANKAGRSGEAGMSEEPSVILPSYLQNNMFQSDSQSDSQSDTQSDSQGAPKGQLGPNDDNRSNKSEADDRITNLKPIEWPDEVSAVTSIVGSDLSTKKILSVAAEKMSARDFAHYIFGDLLGVNYILDESINAIDSDQDTGITVSTAEGISHEIYLI